MLDKNAAASLIEITTANLELYTSQNRIQARSQKMPRGGTAQVYSKKDCLRLRDELKAEAAALFSNAPLPPLALPVAYSGSPPAYIEGEVTHEGLHAPGAHGLGAHAPGAHGPNAMQHNGQLVGNSTALVRTEPAQPLVPVKNERKSVDADSVLVASLRLTLRVTDAILLSNMPSGIVKEAVKNGELKSIGTGRNRRIKRSALDAWLETLG